MTHIPVVVKKSDIKIYAEHEGTEHGGVKFVTFSGTRKPDGLYHGVYIFDGGDEKAARRAFKHLPGLGE